MLHSCLFDDGHTPHAVHATSPTMGAWWLTCPPTLPVQAAGIAVPGDDGSSSSLDAAVAAAQAYLLSRPGVRTVVVSRGSEGCTARSGALPVRAVRAVMQRCGMPLPLPLRPAPALLHPATPPGTTSAAAADGAVAQSPACGVPVVDTVGAGDYFTAGFLHAQLAGASLVACTSCGCAAGTAAVQAAGAELGDAALQQLRRDIAAILAVDAAGAGAGAGSGSAGAAAAHDEKGVS